MGNDREALKNLSTERVSFPHEMAVSDEVWAALAAIRFPILVEENGTDTYYNCPECFQGIAPDRLGSKGMYSYTEDELNGLKLAHMIQRHGWTRETPNAEQ